MVKKEKVSYYWKAAFLGLVTIILSLVVVGFYMANQSGENTIHPVNQSLDEDNAIQISLNREQATVFITNYLNQTIGKSKIKFDFELGEQAEIRGTFDQLPIPVEFSLYFKPIVLENGNIKLKATELFIGKLHLPIRVILGFMKQTSILPNIVSIYPKEKEMILHLNKITFNNGMTIAAKDIDLQNDRLTFNINLPLNKKNEE